MGVLGVSYIIVLVCMIFARIFFLTEMKFCFCPATYIYTIFQYQACVYQTQGQYKRSNVLLLVRTALPHPLQQQQRVLGACWGTEELGWK